MAKKQSHNATGQRLQQDDQTAMGLAQAEQAGADFQWHFGRLTRLGTFELAGGREVTVAWEEGSVTSQQGEITDAQWEIFKLAFVSTGRIAVLSDHKAEGWMYDYRFLEAVR
jgi:hypothetical protein